MLPPWWRSRRRRRLVYEINSYGYRIRSRASRATTALLHAQLQRLDEQAEDPAATTCCAPASSRRGSTGRSWCLARRRARLPGASARLRMAAITRKIASTYRFAYLDGETCSACRSSIAAACCAPRWRRARPNSSQFSEHIDGARASCCREPASRASRGASASSRRAVLVPDPRPGSAQVHEAHAFIRAGFTDPKGGAPARLAALAIRCEGALAIRGNVCTASTTKLCDTLKQKRTALASRIVPFDIPPKAEGHWVSPKLIA